MRDDLLAYYERELTFLRQLGAEFAERYPKIAGRLVLEEDKCEDPHVERLIEAFAFLAGRIHRKLDDELPEITEALLLRLENLSAQGAFKEPIQVLASLPRQEMVARPADCAVAG